MKIENNSQSVHNCLLVLLTQLLDGCVLLQIILFVASLHFIIFLYCVCLMAMLNKTHFNTIQV